MTIGRDRTAPPIQIKLKDASQFPHQKQYPLKTEGQRGLLPIINSSKNSFKKTRVTN
jgi:hypothetical protein